MNIRVERKMGGKGRKEELERYENLKKLDMKERNDENIGV